MLQINAFLFQLEELLTVFLKLGVVVMNSFIIRKSFYLTFISESQLFGVEYSWLVVALFQHFEYIISFSPGLQGIYWEIHDSFMEVPLYERFLFPFIVFKNSFFVFDFRQFYYCVLENIILVWKL